MEVHEYYQNKYEPVKTIDEELGLDATRPIIVYTDYTQTYDHLTSPKFRLTEDPYEAQIAWVTVDYYTVMRQKVHLDLDKKYFN